MAVGLVPLALLVGVAIGYLLAQRDGEPTADQGLAAAEAPPTGSSAPVEAAPTGSSVPAETTPVETTATPATDAPAPTEPIVANGMVAAGAVEVAGVLPTPLRAQWVGEMADLAAGIGYLFVDRTEPASADGAGASELVVQFPAAVVFVAGSSMGFDGDPNTAIGAIAGVMNRGTAQLSVIAYADPGKPGAGALALARAEHVAEHLIELDVDPARLSPEARPAFEAPAGEPDGPPVDRRIDVVFRLGS